MSRLNRQHVTDLRGIARIAVDATLGVTGLVEHMHGTIQRTPLPWGRACDARRTRGITGFVYRSVYQTTRLVGATLDAALQPAIDWAAAGTPSPARDALVSALNGLYGDYLVRTRNPLALDMSLRFEDQRLSPAEPLRLRAALEDRGHRARLLVLVHGLCLNERHWTRDGHDHGAALARELGYVPLYVRYNSGLPVATNGRLLASTLERLVHALPGQAPQVAILAHSMGGLVTRSAFEHAHRQLHAWPARVRDCVFLGTPHHGAPLEQAGHGLERVLEWSPYIAPFTRLSRMRSAGITDLRHGRVSARASRHVPLPQGVNCYAIAATLGARGGALGDHLLGDGLVPLYSALGRHDDAPRNLAIPPQRQWVGRGIGHLDLLSHAHVRARLQDWLA